MRIGGFGRFINLMLDDRADIYHYTSTTGADGTTANTVVSTPSVVDEPCRLSFIRLENPADTADSRITHMIPKLFFGISSDIREGDFVVVRRALSDGQVAVYQGQLGLPSIFETHKEVLLEVRGNA